MHCLITHYTKRLCLRTYLSHPFSLSQFPFLVPLHILSDLPRYQSAYTEFDVAGLRRSVLVY